MVKPNSKVLKSLFDYKKNINLFKFIKINEDYGYFFYPQRFGNAVNTASWHEKFFSYGSSREILNKNLCEENVEKCLKTRTLKNLSFF